MGAAAKSNNLVGQEEVHGMVGKEVGDLAFELRRFKRVEETAGAVDERDLEAEVTE
jgi:hypothetical protein